jgi:hypothetical protein
MSVGYCTRAGFAEGVVVELTNREQDLSQALAGTAKSALSLIPVLGQAIAGYDEYRRSQFERTVSKLIRDLQQKVSNMEVFASSEWLRSEDGQQFAWKVLSAALDSQMEEKQEFFVNALIQGVTKPTISHVEKLKFIDMLRNLSKAALMVLVDMHAMFANQVRGPGRATNPIAAYPQIDPEKIAEELSAKYDDPYLVTAAIREMEGQGLFSRTGEWKKKPDGSYFSTGGFATELCYTDFAARFVEFIEEAK